MNSKQVVSIVIPVFNEATIIEKTLNEIYDQLKAICNLEIIIIDDGSTDTTWETLTSVSIPGLTIKSLRLSRRFGKEAALCAGIENATGDAVIVMDGDLQHPPELLPLMYHSWKEEGFDVVEGIKESRGEESFIKKTGALFAFQVFENFLKIPLRNASDYKLMSRNVVDAWMNLQERNVFFRGMNWWLGFKRKSISFSVSPRSTGQSGWSTMHLIGLTLTGITAFSSAPLRIVSFLGVFFFFFAIFLTTFALWKKFMGIALTGFTTVIILQLIIGSIVMLSLGIIGEYIAKIYDEAKCRPRFILAETHSSNNPKE